MYNRLAAGAMVCLLGAGCVGHEGTSDDSSTDVFEQLVLVEQEDGTIREHIVKGSRRIFQRELEWKHLAARAAELGEPAPPPPDRTSDEVEVDGVGVSRQALYWADDVMPYCYADTLWLTSSSTGNYRPENTFCMRKNSVGGVGTTNLYQFYSSHSNPTCPNNDSRVAACTRSWWAGDDPGVFTQYPNGFGIGPTFSAQQPCTGCAIGNWPHLGFF